MNIRAKIYGSSKPEEPILRGKRPKGAKADELDSVTVPREESRRSNNRGGDRHRLSGETVRVTHGDLSHEAELINVSGGGAMLRGSFGPRLWDPLELHLGDHGTIECVVRWIRGDRVGLEFAHETRLDCPSDEVASVLREVIMRSFPDARLERPPGSEPDEDSRSEDESRREARHPLIWSGVLHHDYQSTNVRVRNISSTGAMIECRAPVRVGSEPLLELNEEASASATVQWVIGDQVGLRFHSPFDMRLLGRSKPEVTPAKWLRPGYLESGRPKADSPWDPRWNRLTMRELSEELEGFLKR